MMLSIGRVQYSVYNIVILMPKMLACWLITLISLGIANVDDVSPYDIYLGPGLALLDVFAEIISGRSPSVVIQDPVRFNIENNGLISTLMKSQATRCISVGGLSPLIRRYSSINLRVPYANGI